MATPSRRSEPRLKVFQPATLHTGGDPARVHVLDVSPRGALVHGLAQVAPGNLMALVCCGWTRAANVAWKTDKRFGVRFVEPLSSGEISAATSIVRKRGDPA
ncbi:PilZ domain-containing protein [Sphingomonas sp. Tas61C01]|uniref:PilZ domain-containing protein n=1 Tax=Sphingomonas sp. Tas61C01 TaxID=3458297 RepID=UPI00403E43B0